MVQRLKTVPDVSDALGTLAAQNPRYALESVAKLDPRVVNDLCAIFKRRVKGEEQERGHNEIVLELEKFRLAALSRAGQMKESELWQANPGATVAQMQGAPRTIAKLLQEVLSAPADHMALSRQQAEHADTQQIIIDPRRISDTLLHDLGLDQFVAPKGTRQLQRLKLRDEAIPEVRAMLQHLQPIRRRSEEGQDMGNLRYFRLLRIVEGSHKGQVLGSQENNGKKILFKTDLYGAERRILHIDTAYKEEVRKLTWVTGVLKNVREHLEFWMNPARRSDLEALQPTLIEMVDSLEFVIDEDKVELRKEVSKALEFKDSRGRKNPNVTQRHLTTATQATDARLRSIGEISSHLGRDRKRVEELIVEEERPMKEFQTKVEEREMTVAQFGDLRRNAKELRFEPAMTFGGKFVAKIDSIEALRASGDAAQVEEARREYIHLYLIAKLYTCFTELQQVYKKISTNPEDVHPKALLEDLKGIDGRLREKLLAANVRTREYDPVYIKVYRLLESLIAQAQALSEEKAEAVPVSEDEHESLAAIISKLKGRSEVLDHLLAAVNQTVQVELFPKGGPLPLEKKLPVFEQIKEELGAFSFTTLLSD